MIALLRCSLLKMCVRLVLNTVPHGGVRLCQPGVAITCRLIGAEHVKIEFSSVRQAALNTPIHYSSAEGRVSNYTM